MKSKVILSQLLVFQESLKKYCDSWIALEKTLDFTMPSALRGVNDLFFNVKVKNLQKKSSNLLEMLTPLKPHFISLTDNDYINILESAITFTTTEYAQSDTIKFVIPRIEEVISILEKHDGDTEIERTDASLIRNNVDSLMVQYLNYLHPEIKKSSHKLFIDGHYQPAIHESIKAINQYIRDKTGSSLDGDSLYNEIFSPKKAVLSFSGRSDVSGDTTLNNEQLGFMDMLKGFSKGVRNVLAHNPAKPEDPQKAFEYLVMASLFCRRIDDTHKVTP
jgi:uncharacterized protein (TIGR02391 family)